MKIGDRVKFKGIVGTITDISIRKFVKNGREIISSTYEAVEDDTKIKFKFYGSQVGKTVIKIGDGDQISIFDYVGGDYD